MPCIVVSEDYIRDPTYQASGKIVVNTKDVYYRPLYDLPNFDATCNNWQALNSDAGKVERVGTLPILMVEVLTPIGQYERFRNRPLRLVNRKPQWVPID